jgi:hypothetical protein
MPSKRRQVYIGALTRLQRQAYSAACGAQDYQGCSAALSHFRRG